MKDVSTFPHSFYFFLTRYSLGHVLLEGDESNGRQVVLSEAEEFHDSGIVLDIRVDVDEQNLQFNRHFRISNR